MHICAWQSADSRVTTDHCRVTLRWVFTKSFLIAWNVQKRCLTVSRRSCDLRPLSRDRSATFFKKISNCLKRPKNVVWQSADGRVTSTTVAWPFSDFFQNFPKSLETSRNVVWQSADGRVTSDHCRVTVQRLFSKLFFFAWNVQKTLFDSRSTVAWPQPLSRDRSATFFKNFANCLKRPKSVVWQSADGRVTSDHCRVTVQRLFSKKILIAWNVEKSLFDSRPTVAWPPTTVAWPFSDFFQNFRKSLDTSRKRCLTVGRRSRDLRLLSRDRSVTFFKNFPNCLKRPKNVVWQSADGRVTPTTVAWPFSDFFQNFPKSLETSKKRCLTVGRRSRDLRPLSRDRLATFFKKNSNCLKRRKIVVWQSADSRVTSDHCRVTVQRLFSKFSQIARNVQKTLFDSRPTVAWPPTTVAWQFSDFFQKISLSLETSKNVIWQLPDGRVTTDYCRLTVQRLFSKNFQIASNVQERCLTVGRRSRDLRSLSRDSGYFLPCLFRTAFAYASVCCLSRLICTDMCLVSFWNHKWWHCHTWTRSSFLEFSLKYGRPAQYIRNNHVYSVDR